MECRVLAFDIEIDGKRWLLAGAEDWKILHLQLTASRYVLPEEISLSVGGTIDRDEGSANSIRWASSSDLPMGTKVTVTLVDTDKPEKPLRIYRYDEHVQESPFTAEEEEAMERAEWLRLKAKFQPD
jgi:hypothetical protein